MEKIYDIIIIGAGASGIFAATQINKEESVLVIDSNEKRLRKVFVSGGGRCNFTNLNANEKYYNSQNPKFCISALKQFSPKDFLNIIEENEIEYYEKHKGQMFSKVSSLDVIKMLEKKLDKNVQLKMNTKVLYVIKNDVFKIKTNDGLFKAKKLIVASGGKSFSKLGASDIGFKIAEHFNIPIIKPEPALVGLASKEFEDLSGLSLPVKIKINKREINDDLLFTHKGLSGPAILKASLFADKKFIIDFYPTKNIFEFLKEQKSKKSKSKTETVLSELFPKKLTEFFIKDFKISNEISNTPDKILNQLGNKINNFEFEFEETLGYDTAEATKGGVDTKHISSKTMEAKNVKDLYFIGEVLDITGYLGGYNLQWAWSSAYACAKSINDSLR